MATDTESKIDENLYSRQLGVFGHEAMGKLIQMDVLIVGLKGLGVETAKNLILAGPRSVTLFDPTPVAITDLQCNYYLQQEHVNKGVTRAEASLPALKELNGYVRTTVLEESAVTEAVLERFHAVVFTGAASPPRSVLYKFSDFCHTHSPPIAFVSGAVRGVAGYAFVDVGPTHSVHDPDGEPLRSAIVSTITRDGDTVTVVTHDGKRHGLSDGDHVVFREVEGPPGICDGTPRAIKNVKPLSFELDNAPADLTGTASGGTVEQVKVGSSISHLPFRERLLKPGQEDMGGMMLTPDLGKFERPLDLHLAFHAIDTFAEAHDGAMPRVRDDGDAAEVVGIAKGFLTDNAEALGRTECDDKTIGAIAGLAETELPALCAFFGGILAQEVVKVTGKFTPLSQFLYLDALDIVPASADASEFAIPSPPTSKYDHLTAIVGKSLMAQLASRKVFLVGAGALGCEYLKNFAMMGMSCGADGLVTVTDMDFIETSNLNRQFLFRSDNVGKSKSLTAAAAAQAMNPDLKVVATEVPVGPDTEATFDDAFWYGQDLITNALDNLKARLYVDGRCVFYRKPLLESGTLGTKANSQVIMPHKTESYGDSQDPPEESIPMCTLRNFPHQIEHCIEWARDLFEGAFSTAVQDAEAFVRGPDAWLAKATAEANASTKRAQLQGVVNALASAKEATFEMCVRQARLLFNTNFYALIRQLLHNFPVDYVDSHGVKFWSGPKRPPQALDFNPDDDTHMGFIVAASQLIAANFGVTLPADSTTPAVLKPILAAVEPAVPAFAPKNVRIKSGDDDDTTEGGDDDDAACEALAKELQALAGSTDGLTLEAAAFEKDDDANFHIDFVTAVANLRARNYKIPEAKRHKVKMIAGKIIPAIATTTCMITGLVAIEMYKVLQDAPLESFRNSFVNLGVNVLSMAEPQPPKKFVSKDYDPLSAGPVRAMPEGFTSWDRIELKLGSLTCGQLVEHFKKEYKLDTMMVSAGPMMLFAPLMYASHRRERTDAPVQDVFEKVLKAPINERRNYIVLDMTVEDDASEVIIPQVQYWFR